MALLIRNGEIVTASSRAHVDIYVENEKISRIGKNLEVPVDAEIIDLRTLLPLDLETIETSVRKTGRCVIVHEATRTSGFGAELCALVQETCFYYLETPIIRVTGWDTPYPHAQEWDYFPGPARVGQALLDAMEP